MQIGDETLSLQEALRTFLEHNQNRVILDLKNVSFIDSTGLGTLVSAHSAFKKAEGAMKLLHLSERHMQLLVLTKLSTVFELFDDEQKAIDSFFPDREVRHFDILEFVKSQEDNPLSFGNDGTEEKADE